VVVLQFINSFQPQRIYNTVYEQGLAQYNAQMKNVPWTFIWLPGPEEEGHDIASINALW